mgnify:CR=1 FL=1
MGIDGRLDLPRTLQVLKDLDADVIALQEVDENVTRSEEVDQAAWLAGRLNMHYAFGSFMDYQGGRYGLAILSRYPIASFKEWVLTEGNEPRVALAANITFPNSRQCTAVAVHFDWVADDAFRFMQASETIQHLQLCSTPWIVFGDFNDVPGSRTMEGFYSIGTQIEGTENGLRSFPADTPRVAIDSIIAGPPEHWIVGKGVVVNEPNASDHRPVRATLELRNSPIKKRTAK